MPPAYAAHGVRGLTHAPPLVPSEPTLTFPLLFASAFMSIFSVVIAFFKDIPDVKGDKRASIQTLSVRLGVRTRAWHIHTLRAAPRTHAGTQRRCAYAGAVRLRRRARC